jgi:enamine deaminase RidA (YjgF/YER057c/UK114 family)
MMISFIHAQGLSDIPATTLSGVMLHGGWEMEGGGHHMQRTAINPWNWSLQFGFNQAELFEGSSRELVCSGQTAVDANGAPQHPGDMRAQLGLALDNLETVLGAAGMTPANLKKLNVYVTDMDAALENYDVLGAKLSRFGATPPMSLIGISRLAMPSLLVEIDATAAD